MRLVKQENKLGCGVACIAAISGMSYKEVLKLFPQNKADTKGFICKEIIAVLKEKKFNYECKYLRPKLRNKIYKEGTIVFIQRSKRYPEGHYIARGDSGWMDPWINFPDKNIKAGLRKKLPGKPIYAILRTDYSNELK